jgi:hypothetical protein
MKAPQNRHGDGVTTRFRLASNALLVRATVLATARHMAKGDVMYQFAVIALLALATVKLVDFIVDFLPSDDRGVMRSLLTFVVAIGGVWALDFSMFAGWGIDLRNENLALAATGLVVAGLTSAWRAIFRYLTHDSATADETLGEHRGSLRKVA